MAKILIVDDRPTNRQFLLTLLGYGGHQLLEAADGAEALARVRDDLPDLVITDILMPIMSGYEFVQHLRADPALASMKVIFHTATYSEPQAHALADSCGVSIVLPKPCEPEQVFAAVNRTLNLSAPTLLPAWALQRIEIAAKDANLVEDTVAGYLQELQSVKLGFEHMVAGGSLPAGQQHSTQELSDQFSRTVAGLTLMASRLSAVVNVGLGLLSERDAEHIVQNCFDAACGVIGSTYAAIGVFDERGTGLRYLLTKGIDRRMYQEPGAGELAALSELLEQGRPLRLKAEPGKTLTGVPPLHPPIRNFLGVPIASSGQKYGWMYFAERLGADEFSKEDLGIACTLALQLALLHENFMLYDTLRDHAVQLQLEVTERKRAENAVRQLNESLEKRIAERTAELEAANQELEAFAYSVSHDLRAPLSILQGFAQLLQQELFAQNSISKQENYVRHIVSSAQHMSTLIQALLRLSHIGRQPIDKSPVNVTALVHEVVAHVREQEPHRAVEIHVGELPDCTGDASLLRQVFVNLLTNAFKFTRQRDNPRVDIGWREKNGEGAYFIADNGVGFDIQHASKLFGAFQRVHSSAQFEGTGIGLSIVHRIIQRHGGRIWAEAAVDKGATFYFLLPTTRAR